MEETSITDKVENSWKQLDKSLPKDKNKRFLVLLLVLIALPLTLYLVQRVVRYFSGAAPSASVYFEPQSTSLPPNTNLKVMVNSGGSQVGFVHLEISFDRSKVLLANDVSNSSTLTMNNAQAEQDPNYNPPQYACSGSTPCIIRTPVVAANNSGKVIIVYGKNPTDTSQAPSGIFELAQLQFMANTTAQTTTTVSITRVQVVDTTPSAFNVSTGTATLTLNAGGPTNTPSFPTSTPTTGASPTPAVCSPTTGDVNYDGVVNVLDIIKIVQVYQSSPPTNPCADVNGDNTVNVLDIIVVVQNYTFKP
jgi:hypothetical protein